MKNGWERIEGVVHILETAIMYPIFPGRKRGRFPFMSFRVYVKL